MSKFCSKQELEDIQQENRHPNVAQKQKEEIEAFTEKLISNINEKLCQREALKASLGKINKNNTNLFDQRSSHRHRDVLVYDQQVFKNCHTFDNKKLNKFVLKNKVRNLSPISKEPNDVDNSHSIDSNDQSKYFISKEILYDQLKSKSEINIIKNDSSVLPKNFKISSLAKGNEIRIVNSITEDIKPITSRSLEESKEIEFKPVEEIKQEDLMQFSIHENSRLQAARLTKGTLNNTDDDFVNPEMIQITGLTQNSHNGKKCKKSIADGIKLIQKSLKSTTKTMNQLLGLFMSDE